MKRAVFLLAGMLATVQIACADEKPIDYDKLPGKAKAALSQYFVNQKPVSLLADPDVSGRSYEAFFSDGSRVEFDSKGNWTDIEIRGGIPDGIVPAAISAFTKEHYGTNRIVKMERDRKGFELKLDNGLELKFDKNQRFLKYD